MPDLENKNPETIENTEPSTEPLNSPLSFPKLAIKELEATYEMLVGFKKAVLSQKWEGPDVQNVAMGLMWINQMEIDHRNKLEVARREQKEAIKKAQEAIKQAGGKVNE